MRAGRGFYVGRASRLPSFAFFHRPSAANIFRSQAGRLRYTAIALAIFSLASTALAEPQRIVTAGSAITEIVRGLGLEDRLVAVDTSSRALPGMEKKPDIGYVRMLGAEGILSRKPDLILVSSEAGPLPVLEQIRKAGVELVVIEGGHDLNQVDEKIRIVAKAVGREAQAEGLLADHDTNLQKLRAAVESLPKHPKVVFLHARGGNNLMAAGTDTAAHAMIEASGGTNACAGFEGYKPLSAESLVAMKPDFVLISESVLGSDEDLLKTVPGLAQTPAAKNDGILRVEDAAFLGFGPRSAAAARLVTTMLGQP
jgi:iron complex transport system substrate-binding protein